MNCLLPIALLGLLLNPAWAGIPFEDDFDQALQLAAAQERPAVVYFTARWCGWCRKMDSSTFVDPAVEKFSESMVWVKVDIDEHPEVAAIFGVRGVPHTLVINTGRVVGSRGGYMPPDRFVQFLRDALTASSADELTPQMQDLLLRLSRGAATPQETEVAVKLVLDELAKPQRQNRAAYLRLLGQASADAWPALVAGLDDARLAARAAAGDALARVTGADLTFDPFAPVEQRAQQANAWRRLVADRRARMANPPTTQPAHAPSGMSDIGATTPVPAKRLGPPPAPR